MVRYLDKYGVKDQELEEFDIAIKTGCSNIAQARQEFIDEAMEKGRTHVLFIDDDMTFPVNMLDALANRGVPFIGVNGCRKTPDELRYTALGLDGDYMQSKGRDGIEEATRMGTGIMLVSLEHLKMIPKPYFEMRWLPEHERVGGEDFYFCQKVRAHGFRVFVDNDVSQMVGHVGVHEFRYDSYISQEELKTLDTDE